MESAEKLEMESAEKLEESAEKLDMESAEKSEMGLDTIRRRAPDSLCLARWSSAFY
jgi:hypothetical protein